MCVTEIVFNINRQEPCSKYISSDFLFWFSLYVLDNNLIYYLFSFAANWDSMVDYLAIRMIVIVYFPILTPRSIEWSNFDLNCDIIHMISHFLCLGSPRCWWTFLGSVVAVNHCLVVRLCLCLLLRVALPLTLIKFWQHGHRRHRLQVPFRGLCLEWLGTLFMDSQPSR